MNSTKKAEPVCEAPSLQEVSSAPRAPGESSRRRLLREGLWLYAVHLAGYIVPMAALPFLARALQPHGLGMVALCQSLAAWGATVVEYGFGLSATRELVKSPDDHSVRRLVSAVLAAQIVLAALVSAALVVHGFATPALRAEPKMIGAALLLMLSTGFSPLWYYQGKQRLSTATSTLLGTRATAAVAGVLLANSPHDAWKVLALQAIGGVVGTLLLYVRMPDFRRVRPCFGEARWALRMGWPLFVGRGAISLYTSANGFLIGAVAPPATVGIYGCAEKVLKAVSGLIWPLTQTLYPRANKHVMGDRRRAGAFLRKAAVLYAAAGILLGGGLFVGAGIIVKVMFGEQFRAAEPVLRLLALQLPALALSNLLGIQWMLPRGMDKQFNLVTMGAGLLNLAGLLFLARKWGALGAAASVTLCEVLIAVAFLAVVVRRSGRRLAGEGEPP